MLSALRLTTIVLLMVMLSELLLSGTRSGRPRMAILVDLSASMGVVDPNPTSDLPTALQNELDALDTPPSRLQIAKQVLLASKAEQLRQWQEQFEVELLLVGDGARSTKAGQSPTDAVNDITANQPDALEGATRLGDAIGQVLDDPARPPPQAILVLTDGQNTAGRDLSAAAESARRAVTPLYFVGIGADQAPPDFAITDLLADEVAFVDDLVSLRATLRTQGETSSPVRVVLRKTGDTTALAEQTLPPPTAGSSTPLQLLFRPAESGTFQYEIAVEPIEGERDLQNNLLEHTLTVHDGKLRVLVAAGYPSYEFRYLKHLLERDSTIELSTLLQEADAEYATTDPSAISRFPIRATELDEYDVVVLMDLDPRLMPRSTWKELRTFVAKKGGGLALVSGPRYLPWAYRNLDDFKALLPVQADRAPLDGSVTSEGFSLSPTELGIRLPAMQIDDNLTETRRIWRTLSPLYWHADLGVLKPAAQVLAQHPTAVTSEGQPAPLIISQYFGGGNVLLHAVDSTYRWRYRVGEVYFARYWVQTLRNLARGKLSGGDQSIRLATDRAAYERGEPVRLRLRLAGADAVRRGDPQEPVTIILESDGAQQRVALTPQPALPGVFEATLDDLPVGRYRLLLADRVDEGAPIASSFEVVPPPGEFTALERNAQAMQAAAERTRGAYIPVEESNRLAEVLPEARRVPIETLPPIELWNRWWMLAAIVGCLSTEWILRKRKAMM